MSICYVEAVNNTVPNVVGPVLTRAGLELYTSICMFFLTVLFVRLFCSSQYQYLR